jgi:hypothetical protein
MSTTLYRIHGPAGPIGEPGPAYAISQECTRLNDAANPNPDVPRVVVYRVERIRP